MREQEVWLIGGPVDICQFFSYPLCDTINLPFMEDCYLCLLHITNYVYERVGLDIYLCVAEE